MICIVFRKKAETNGTQSSLNAIVAFTVNVTMIHYHTLRNEDSSSSSSRVCCLIITSLTFLCQTTTLYNTFLYLFHLLCNPVSCRLGIAKWHKN